MQEKRVIFPLQAIRAFAFVMVFIYHGTGLNPLGIWGVSVFFSLSGFVMTYSYWERNLQANLHDAFLFSYKKIKKLFPLHIIMLLFGLLREVLITSRFSLSLLGKLSITIPLIQTWLPKGYQALNSVDWYLSVTLFLYFIFPFLLKWFRKTKSFTKIIVVAIMVYLFQLIIGFLINRFLPQVDIKWFVYCFPVYRAGDFFIGCATGYLFIHKKREHLSKTIATFNAVIVSLVILLSFGFYRYLVFNNFQWFTYTCLFVPSSAFLVYIFAYGDGWLSYIITNKLTLYLAGISSYAFLIHRQLLYYVDYSFNLLLDRNINKWLITIISFVLTIVTTRVYLEISKRLFFKCSEH